MNWIRKKIRHYMHTVNIKLLFNHMQDNINNKKAYIHEYFIIYTLSIKTLQN